MKTLFYTLAILVSSLAMAQVDAMDKLEAAKIALITERLELTPEQAEKFWPIYRQYAQEQQNIRREFQELKKGYDPQKASDIENKQMLDKGLKLRERQLDLDKTYTNRMQNVITTRQLMSLRKAEDDFKQMLIKRIRQQQQQRQDMQNQRQRNNENMRQRKN